MRIKYFFNLLLLFAILALTSCGIKSRISKADKRFEVGEYFQAGEMYKKVYSSLSIKEKPLRGRIAYFQAECYRLTNQSRAELTYLNAIRNNYSDSTVFLRYAQLLHRNAKYAEAIKNYELFLKKDSTSIEAKNGLQACKMIPEWKKNPTRYSVKRSKEFNATRSSSFSPSFMGSDADMIVFTSTRQPNKKLAQKNSKITGLPINKMFSSRKNISGKWESINLLEGEVSTLNDEGVCSFGDDGKVIYYSRSSYVSDGGRGTEILSSNRAGGTWSKPQKINFFKDSTFSVAHPAISPQSQTIFFVSDAANGQGGKDLWKGTIDNGVCKYIENLGPDINTPGDEMFPTLKNDSTLFYSSNGLPGFGGLDIYKATYSSKNAKWTVQNMGIPINSNADDFGITFSGNNEKGYFSTNRNETRSYDAIWSFELPEFAYLVEGKVVDDKGNVIPDASVRIVSNTGLNAKVQTKKDGTYRMKLEKDMDCVMLASARGYLNQKNVLSTFGVNQSKNFKVDFFLSQLSKAIQLDNIFYEFGKWELTQASEAGLQTLVKVLNDNPTVIVEIGSHTDYIGSNAANLVLSEKRAKSVVDYLIKVGIAPKRLTTKGNGEEFPVVVDAAISQKYPYLKENTVLDETYVLTLTPEQQEIVNQINRRTEFRVIKTSYSPF